ncbi:MAG: UbiA family prenyltransferase [Candidatus Omnitrophica bacterium]|nr:UbiA family prenyltransferase [Candidatus Omnitrophota bacterium]
MMTSTKLQTYASFVKLEHAMFSLPLIFAGALLRLRHWPDALTTVLALLAAVGARAMGMGMNRLIDAEIDARNPRTRHRELPRGVMTRNEAWGLVVGAGVLYLICAALIAPICLWLSPIPVLLFAVYPHLKRFTSLAHVGLGLAWSTAPVAGWLAASKSLQGIGEVSWLWLFAVLWVAGFDIIYATMDEAFDRAEGLHALPARLGKAKALQTALVLHIWAFVALASLWRGQLHTGASLWWLLAIGVAFIWQHAIADRNPEFAFFKLNGLIGFLVFGMVWSGSRSWW